MTVAVIIVSPDSIETANVEDRHKGPYRASIGFHCWAITSDKGVNGRFEYSRRRNLANESILASMFNVSCGGHRSSETTFQI